MLERLLPSASDLVIPDACCVKRDNAFVDSRPGSAITYHVLHFTIKKHPPRKGTGVLTRGTTLLSPPVAGTSLPEHGLMTTRIMLLPLITVGIPGEATGCLSDLTPGSHPLSQWEKRPRGEVKRSPPGSGGIFRRDDCIRFHQTGLAGQRRPPYSSPSQPLGYFLRSTPSLSAERNYNQCREDIHPGQVPLSAASPFPFNGLERLEQVLSGFSPPDRPHWGYRRLRS